MWWQKILHLSISPYNILLCLTKCLFFNVARSEYNSFTKEWKLFVGWNASSDSPLLNILPILSFLVKVGCSIWCITLNKLLLVWWLTIESSNSSTDGAIGSSIGCRQFLLVVWVLHLLRRARKELARHGAEVFNLTLGGPSYLLCSHAFLCQRADICTALSI